MKKVSLVALLFAASSALLSPLASAADAPPGVASFFRDPAIRAVQLSPKGRYVALLLGMPDENYVLAIRDTADLKKVTVATTSKTGRIDAIHWISEERIGFTIRDLRVEFESNHSEFAVDRDGSNMTQLISGDFRHTKDTTGSVIKSKVLTSEFAYFAPTHDGSDDIIVAEHLFNDIDSYAQSTQLHRLNTRTRHLAALPVGRPPGHVLRWIVDNDDAARVLVSKNAGRCIAYYRADGSDDWSEIASNDCYHQPFTPRAFDGKDSLLVSADYHGTSALFRYNLATRQRDKEALLAVDGFDFGGTLETDFATKKVVGIHINGDAHGTVWLDPRFAAIQAKLKALLPQTTNEIHCGQDCTNAPALLVTSSSDRQPPQYYVYTVATNTLVGLGGDYPDIKPAQMGLRDFYRYTARDGRAIPVYVTMPPGKASGPLPAVVLVHGGPGMRGGSWEWDDEAQFLASRGYMVLQPEFRGSMGFGFDHFAAGWKQWGGTMQSDLADAASWAITKGWADPKRIGIMGASYGGYATLMGLIQNPELFRCGVDFAGVADVTMMFNTAEDDASQESLHYDMKMLIGDPATDAALFAKNSPLLHADKLTQPLLIGQGALDRRVPLVHATSFRSAVSKNNAHVEWIVYADEGHGLRHQNNRIDYYARVEAFLEKNLKNAQ